MRKRTAISLVVVFFLLLQAAPLVNRVVVRLARWLVKRPFEPAWPRSSIVAYDIAHLDVADQMWDLAYALHFACQTETFVSISSVLLDLGSGQRGQLEDFIDIEATNRKLNCTRIVPWRMVETSLTHVTGSPEWLHDAWERSSLSEGRDTMLTKLVFAGSLRWQGEDRAELPKQYYGIHLRLDMDMIIRECAGYESYLQWLAAGKTDKATQIAGEVFSRQETKRFAEKLMDEYHEHVARLFVDRHLPIVIATGLAWQHSAQTSIEAELLNITVSDLRPRRVLLGRNASPHRELNAAADLVVMMGADVFIGYGNSIFSRTVAEQLRVRGRQYALIASSDC